jgi:hypothetical protein
MKTFSKVAVLASLAVTASAQKGRFEAKPAASYAARQSVEKVTIAVEPYESGQKQKEAFGKANPSQFGVLPVLLVIVNDSDTVLDLERMRVEFVTADRQRVEPTPSEEIHLSGKIRRPDLGPQRPQPIPGVKIGGRKPKPDWEISAREFVAPVLPPRSSAHGFFYFRLDGAQRLSGAKVYIAGIRDAKTARDLFYFEIELDPYVKSR